MQHLKLTVRLLWISLLVWILIAPSSLLYGQMAAGYPKFVGNIFRSEVPATYDTYWNQVTPENSGKWGTVEAQRDVMVWTDLDLAYNYAQQHGFIFKQHAMIWGLQEPPWIAGLSAAEQVAEIEEWMQAYAARYPATDLIDVVNEPLHVVPSYADAIGGSGATGWDWVIWSYEKARQYYPNAQLILNDYGILGSRKTTTDFIAIIELLQDRGLIDAIGVQAHGLEYARDNNILNSLDRLAATGLPIYVSELDLEFADDNDQLNRYQSLFPLLYEHPGVVGVTLWGYEFGKHWKPDAYLLGSGETLAEWTLTTTFQDYQTTGTGNIQVSFINDSGTSGNDVEVDYVILDGTTHQAEDMAENTGVYQDNSCGGSFSQWMHCNGYIQFPSATQDITVRARGVTGNEIIRANTFNATTERPALTWLRTVYFAGAGTGPTVAITNPANGSVFAEGTNVTVTAQASDSDGTVTQVEFLANGNSIGTATAEPYEVNWVIPVGNFTLTAVATDNDNISTTSDPVDVTGQSTSGGGTLHVSSIVTSVVGGTGKGEKSAQAIVTIMDDQGNPVMGANVTGTFSGTFNETANGQTQTDGTVTFKSVGSKKGSVSVGFCVDQVTHPTLTYDPAANVMTCEGAGFRVVDLSSFTLLESSQYPGTDHWVGTTFHFVQQVDERVLSVAIFDMSGRRLLHLNAGTAPGQVDLSPYYRQLPRQAYVLRVLTDRRQISSLFLTGQGSFR